MFFPAYGPLLYRRSAKIFKRLFRRRNRNQPLVDNDVSRLWVKIFSLVALSFTAGTAVNKFLPDDYLCIYAILITPYTKVRNGVHIAEKGSDRYPFLCIMVCILFYYFITSLCICFCPLALSSTKYTPGAAPSRLMSSPNLPPLWL